MLNGYVFWFNIVKKQKRDDVAMTLHIGSNVEKVLLL